MFEQTGSSGGGVLRSEQYLSTDFQPEDPVGRDGEIERIAQSLRPLTRGETPENLLVYGSAGVGKTTCVKHVFDRLEEETRVKPVYLNCWQYNTRSSLLTQLLINLGYPAPRKGKPVDRLLSILQNKLDGDRSIAVALDEIDQLQERTQVIYDLTMAAADADKELGLVMISNQAPREIELDPRSQSRLNCQTLQFEPYSAPVLEKILQSRVEKAFRPNSVDNQVLERISEAVSERGGDCREALQYLTELGRKADREDRREITVDDLETVL